MLSAELKRLRERAEISQTSLARALGVRQSTVAMWENGKNNPGYETLLRIADFFGVTTDELRGSGDAPRRVPVLGRVAAGPPKTATEDIVGYEEISPELAETGEFFALGEAVDRDGDSVIKSVKIFEL